MYTQKREELRQKLLPLACMLDLRCVFDFQDASFEFNPHSARSAGALLEIGDHEEKLALAGFSEGVVGQAAAPPMQMGHSASNQWRVSGIEPCYYMGDRGDQRFYLCLRVSA